MGIENFEAGTSVFEAGDLCGEAGIWCGEVGIWCAEAGIERFGAGDRCAEWGSESGETVRLRLAAGGWPYVHPPDCGAHCSANHLRATQGQPRRSTRHTP
jgi:hypothetical protein